MKYNELNIKADKQRTRVGRGIAAGKGKTAGRGTKGQNARTGGGVRLGFEGGQQPLMQRLPKLRGFRAIKPKAEVVYTGNLNALVGKIDNFSLAKAGLISNPYIKVKVVDNGVVKKKLNLHTQGASKGAVKAIIDAGGSFTKVDILKKEKIQKT